MKLTHFPQLKRYDLVLFALILLAPGLSWGQSKLSWPLEIFDVMDNKQLVIFVRDEDIAKSPQWQPAKGGPAMGVATVINKVNQWVAQDIRLKGLTVHEIELKPIKRHKNHWYYLVHLGDSHHSKKTSYVAVLFSGKVVPAMVKPVSIK